VNVRLELPGEYHCFHTIAGLANHTETGILQQAPEAISNHDVVICNYNAQGSVFGSRLS
jgi:aerobic-type carbon monoxide dehydrogenase small subunit (CoxS/CutS family)